MAVTRSASEAEMIANLVSMVSELKKSNELLEEQMRQDRASREATPGGTRTYKEAKTADPDKSDGKDAHALGRFITQCSLTFGSRPHAFPNDPAKIKWMTTFLRGSAFDSVQALMIAGDKEDKTLKEYTKFIRYLRDSFGDPERKVLPVES